MPYGGSETTAPPPCNHVKVIARIPAIQGRSTYDDGRGHLNERPFATQLMSIGGTVPFCILPPSRSAVYFLQMRFLKCVGENPPSHPHGQARVRRNGRAMEGRLSPYRDAAVQTTLRICARGRRRNGGCPETSARFPVVREFVCHAACFRASISDSTSSIARSSLPIKSIVGSRSYLSQRHRVLFATPARLHRRYIGNLASYARRLMASYRGLVSMPRILP